MKHIIKHDLDLKTAHLALHKALDSYGVRFAQYKPTCTWPTNTQADIGFTVKGVRLTGKVQLVKGGIALELDVPFLFRVFKGKALEVIEGEIREWIEKAKAGKLAA